MKGLKYVGLLITILAVVMLVLLLVSSALAAPFANLGDPIPSRTNGIPNSNTAIVNGNESEWITRPVGGWSTTGLTADVNIMQDNPDWFANMCNVVQGCDGSGHGPFADLYLRYNCDPANPTTGTLYMLFLVRPGNTYLPDANNSTNDWVKIGGGNTKLVGDGVPWTSNTTPPMWRDLSDGQGAEAAISLAPGSHSLQFHIEANTSNTSSTGDMTVTLACVKPDSHNNHGSSVILQNLPVTVTDHFVITSSFSPAPTGSVQWFYCYSSNQVTGLPNGCKPGASGFITFGTPVNIIPGTASLLGARHLAAPALPSSVTTSAVDSPGLVLTSTTRAGRYCFFAIYTPDSTGITNGYTSLSHFNNTTQCFTASTPTAITLSSFKAETDSHSAVVVSGLALALVLLLSSAGLVMRQQSKRQF